jgi:hypothetical protein
MSTLQSVILIDAEAILSAKPSANTFVVDVLEGESVISVKQIRQLISWLGQYGYEPGAKRAIILQAERWHFTAPEALLKSLEEPIEQTAIILTTKNPSSLPVTIRSRCAILPLSDVPDRQLNEWGLGRTESKPADTIEMTWLEFSQLAMPQKWLAIEPWFKKANWPIILQSWQSYLLQQLTQPDPNQTQQLVRQLAAIQQCQLDLKANILPRLAIDRLILTLDSQ